MANDACNIRLHDNQVIDSLIKELCYNNVADCYRVANLVKSEGFKEYCKNDSVAQTDDFTKIKKPTLRRLIREYRNANTFSVRNNTTVNTNSGMYDFKSREVYNTAVNYVADTAFNIYTNKLTAKQRNNPKIINTIKATVKKAIKIELARRLNVYNADNKFDFNTSLETLVYYAYNTEVVTEADKNYADLVTSAYGDINFWHEAFNRPKVVNLGLKLTDEDQAEKESLMNDVEDNILNDSEQSDEIDLSTKQWDIDKNYNDYGKHVSEEVKGYLNSLPKLASTVRYKNGAYDIDRNNSLNVPTYHTYQEIVIELADVINNGGWKSLNECIDVIEQVANNKKEFTGLVQLVDKMKNDNNFANAVYKDINKYNVDVLEIDIDSDGYIESVQSNTRNNPTRQLYYSFRNAIKSSCMQVNNVDFKADIRDLSTDISNYKTSLQRSKSGISGARGAIGGNTVESYNNIIYKLKELYRSYFPNIELEAIDAYIVKSQNGIQTIEQLITILESINNGASNTAEERRKRDYIRSNINYKNKLKRQQAIEAGADPNTIKYEQVPSYNTDYVIGLDAPLSTLAELLSSYLPSKAELNYRNINNNLQSGLIFNNYITNTVKALSDPKTLKLWIEDKLRNPKEYAYSNILIDRPEQGIKGIARFVNGKYQLTEYAPYLIHTYLLNGIANIQIGVAKDYTNMSDADYFLTGFYAFNRSLRSYRNYDIKQESIPSVAPYIMRTPSDAPKNFFVTLPKYDISDLYNYNKAEIDKLVNDEVAKYNKYYTPTQFELIASKANNQSVQLDDNILSSIVIGTVDSIRIDRRKLFIDGNKAKFAVETKDYFGDGFIWFEASLKTDYNTTYADNIQYLGKQDKSECQYAEFNRALKSNIENKIKQEHPEYKTVNHNSAIFNILRNTVLGEISEYLQAEEYCKTHDKQHQIEWYHYNPKTGKPGNVFHISKLDASVYEIAEGIEYLLETPSSTGEQHFRIDNYTGTVVADTRGQDFVDNAVDRWIQAYETYAINFARNQYGDFIEEESDYDIANYMFNAYIANMQFDDLFEGNSKYYANPQTFLKRAKEVQAGGTSYGSWFNPTEFNSNPFVQSTNNTGQSINVGGKQINIRTGWSAITIKNVKKGSENQQEIYNSLIKAGLSKKRAAQLAGPFGYDSSADEELNGETWADSTKVDDAQSYITIYEAARRIKLMGEYPRYEKLLNQLTDDTTRLEDINPNELISFIQVFKNFYYDQYYDTNLNRHVSRQIKNAEFVLVPKFLGEDTSLGRLARIMIDNDIDQVNTQETSKATNYEVIEYWDEKTGIATNDLEGFAKQAVAVKHPYSYMYLYRQQEVPQHILNQQNKAGIQVMKKVLDNLYYASQQTKNYATNFNRAYVANIKESFNELMDKFGIKFDSHGDIVSTSNKRIDYKKIYRLAQTEMARLGVDSNMMDYVTAKNNNGAPVMPNLFNIVANKIESVAQSQFNKNITRQKLPGWHAAQVTGIGLEGHIRQLKGESTETDTGKRVQLQYHVDDNIVEILLPKWASSMFNQYDKDGNLIKEINIEDCDEDILMSIGYRIPSEGKQSMAVMKVVGFLPEWMGSTIVVPDEWVTQTGSDFDVDSVYGIAYETYLGRDGRVHKVEYIDGQDEDSTWIRYANYVNRNVNKLIKEENAIYLSDDEKKAYREKARRVVDELNKEENDKFPAIIKALLNDKESSAWEMLSDNVKERLTPIFKNKTIKFKDRVTQIISELNDIELNQGVTDGTQVILEVYQEIAKVITAQIDFNRAIAENVRELMTGIYKEYFRNAINNRAAAGNLMSFEEFNKLSVEEQNSRKARNNRILDSMIGIMNSKDAIAENLARSNFDDIQKTLEKIDDMFNNNTSNANVYNPFTQIRFRRNAMSGAILKAFSVTRDTANSIFNVSRAQLAEPIRVKYNWSNETYRANENDAEAAFDIDENGYVIHRGLANSKNDKNVAGEYITVASSHTTAHILDAIKSGAIPNENEYTFAAFKTLFDIGMDAYSAILWLRQPGISRIVDAYFEGQSVFARGNYNPVHTAIKRIAAELGVKVNNETVTDTTPIANVISALQREYGEQFSEITDGGIISLDYNNNAIRNINIPQIEDRIVVNVASSTGERLLDLKAILNFDYINTNVARPIQQHARVLNPDKFGAKQTIFETRKTFSDIEKLYTGKVTNKILVDGKPVIDAIYPGLIKDDQFNIRSFLTEDKSKDSKYPSLYAFLRYSTAPSIIINKNLFETETDTFVEAIENIGAYIPNNIDKQLYTSFKQYVLDSMYKQYSDILTLPITVNERGIINLDTSADNMGSSSVEDGVNVDKPTAYDAERLRIYGFGYSSNYNINIANVNKPTVDEINEFNKLTPAQKVIFVQQHLSDTERSIFNNIEANLYDERKIRTTSTTSHVIQFNDQQQDREIIYDMFEQAFFNKNPLIKLTAIDIIKYAFVVEGYRFSRRAIGKIIKNSTLYTEIHEGGTGLVSNLLDIASQIDKVDLANDNVYEDYFRSHNTIRQIPTYHIRYTKNIPNLTQLPNSSGMYYFNLRSAQDVAKAKEIELIEEVKDSKGNVKNKIRTYYININRRRNTTLYKLIPNKSGNTVTELYLAPLNNLEENEHGKFSVNDNNNKFPEIKYYKDIINEHNVTNQSFKELAAAGNVLFTKEGIKPYRAPRIQQAKKSVPVERDYIANNTQTDGAIKQLVDNINKTFADNSINTAWLWCGSLKLKNAFESTQEVSVQSIVDDNGKINDYIIRRATIKNVDKYKVTNPTVQAGILAAKDNGIKYLDTIYVISKFQEPEIVEASADEGEIKQSAIDIDIEQNDVPQFAELSQLGELAQDFMIDLGRRARVRGDANAVDTLADIHRYGVIEDLSSTIEKYKTDTIKRSAVYYASESINILNRINNFVIDHDGTTYAIDDINLFDKLKDNSQLLNDYIEFILSASTFGDTFQLINEISEDNLDNNTKNNLKQIRDSIAKIRTNPKLTKSVQLLADKIFSSGSTNPIIRDGLGNVSDYVTKDASFGDKLFQSARELSIPIIQLILKRAVTHVYQRNLEGRAIVREYKKYINDIKKRAANDGLEINWDNIVNSETGRWRTNFNEQFYEDKSKLYDAVEAAKVKGIFTKEYILANRAYREFLYNYTKQEFVDDYYKDILDNEQAMLVPANIDYYIEYIKLEDERNRILRISKSNRTEENTKRLREIRLQIAQMRSDTDATGEWKNERDMIRAQRLDAFIKGRAAIGAKYFNHPSRKGFENDLKHYLDVINKHRKYDSQGRLITDEQSLLQIPEYAFAVEWIEENTIFDYDAEIKKRVNDAFNTISNGKRSNAQFKSIVSVTSDAYDSMGVINGTAFNIEQVAAIKAEQEANYNRQTNDGNSGLVKLIRNRQPDEEIYSKAFYDKFKARLNNPTSGTRNELVRKINGILERALEPTSGKIFLSRLSISEIRELNTLYDELGNISNTNGKSEEVKQFIKEEVEFAADRKQWMIDEDAAKQKGNDYYKVWKTLANQRDWETGAYLNSPNSMIFGYVKPRADKNGNIKEEYLDKKKSEALRFINKNIRFVPTRYYWEARQKAIEEDRLAEWEKANHVYNPYSHRMEPLRIWTQIEIEGVSGAEKSYKPNYHNTKREALDSTRNTKYAQYSTNYKDNGNKYKVEDKTNKYERELRDYLMNTMYSLSKNNPAAMKFVSRGMLPRRRKASNNLRSTVSAVGNFFGFSPTVDNDRGLSHNISYSFDRNHNLPMLETLKDGTYREHLKQREQKIDETDEHYAEYIENLRKENREIDDYNRKLDASLMDKNYEDIFAEFITRAIDSNAKAETRTELYFLIDYLEKYFQTYDITGFGNLKKDRRKSTNDRNEYRRKKAENALEVVKTFAGRFLFDEYKPRTKFDRLASVLQNISSAKYMMFNLRGGIGNILTGSANIFMERFAGDYIEHAYWEEAKFRYYVPNIPSFVLNSGSETSNNLIDGVIKMFSIIDYAGVTEQSGIKDVRSLPDAINKLKNASYFPQSSGEHFMQNTALIAMMLSHRIVNGKIMSFNDFISDRERIAMEKILENHPELLDMYKRHISRVKQDKNKLKDYMWFKQDANTTFLRAINNKEIGREYIKIRKELIDKAKKDFKEYNQVISQFRLVDGYADLIENAEITYKELANFKDKVISVNEKIHGIYSQLGGARIETTSAWGSLIMQYHKHLYNGFLKRYRINGYYNESRQTIERGCYVTFWNFITTEFTDLRQRINDGHDEDGTAKVILAIQEVGRSIANTFLNWRFNYGIMSISERNNLRRCLGDLVGITFGLLMGLAAQCLLLGLDDDDDELLFAANWMMNQADRLSSETIAYSIGVPSELKKTWSNPVAIGSSINDLISSMGWIVQWLIQGDEFNAEFQTGQYAGESKIGVYIRRQIPIYRNVEALANLEQNNSYYKLGENMLGILNIKDVAEWIVKDK